ncbi:hypothetical protein QJS66_23685 (plasmid) [Kocuria rhizophila]|nr:hypothetical protein QJS66_23685 [Kocuria rhizophila]
MNNGDTWHVTQVHEDGRPASPTPATAGASPCPRPTWRRTWSWATPPRSTAPRARPWTPPTPSSTPRPTVPEPTRRGRPEGSSAPFCTWSPAELHPGRGAGDHHRRA